LPVFCAFSSTSCVLVVVVAVVVAIVVLVVIAILVAVVVGAVIMLTLLGDDVPGISSLPVLRLIKSKYLAQYSL